MPRDAILHTRNLYPRTKRDMPLIDCDRVRYKTRGRMTRDEKFCFENKYQLSRRNELMTVRQGNK